MRSQCRWKSYNNGIDVCCCGYAFKIGQSVTEEDCEECVDWYSYKDEENETRVDDSTESFQL